MLGKHHKLLCNEYVNYGRKKFDILIIQRYFDLGEDGNMIDIHNLISKN